MRRFLVADVRLHSKSLLATLSIGALAAAVILVPSPALAGCAEDSECVETHGDYSTRVEGQRNDDGGDGSGGSQVIDGNDVDGDVRVDADNDSDHADADGGAGPSKVEMIGGSTSADVVEGSNMQVTSDPDGSVGLDETGTGQTGEDIVPLAPPTQVPETSTTPESDPRAEAPRDTSSIAAPARAMPSVVQDGARKLVLRSEGSAVSGDSVAGGQIVAVVAMTGETTITATNRSVFSSARSGAAEGKVEHQSVEGEQQSVEENEEVESTDDVDDAVMHLSSPSTSASTSSGGGGVVAQTATPLASEVNEDDDAQPDPDSGAAQSTSLVDSTSVMAVSGEQTTTRSVVHNGGAVEEHKTILGVNGGDAIAGGQVISVVTTRGDVSVDASNQSLDTQARGGDAATHLRTGTAAAPHVSLTGKSTEGSPDATGTGQSQQFGSHTATGAVNPSSNETPSSSDSGPATGSASVQQTASTTSGPSPPNDLSDPP
jgi:hypothetical protein